MAKAAKKTSRAHKPSKNSKLLPRRRRSWHDRDFDCRFDKEGYELHGQHPVHCLK